MKVRFLLDENLSPRLKVALQRLNPAIDVLRVGDPNAPPLGAPDAEVLNYLALTQRLLVTDNRKSTPGHFAAAVEALERHNVVTCENGVCRYSVDLMRRWVATKGYELL